MGGERRLIWVGLALIMVLGFAVYFKLWTIDYSISSSDTDLIRKQFDLANMEAMDESAEWRMKYDMELEKATKCVIKLKNVKDSFKNKVDGVSNVKKLEMVEKENMALLERVEALKQELEAEKLKCSVQ